MSHDPPHPDNGALSPVELAAWRLCYVSLASRRMALNEIVNMWAHHRSTYIRDVKVVLRSFRRLSDDGIQDAETFTALVDEALGGE